MQNLVPPPYAAVPCSGSQSHVAVSPSELPSNRPAPINVAHHCASASPYPASAAHPGHVDVVLHTPSPSPCGTPDPHSWSTGSGADHRSPKLESGRFEPFRHSPFGERQRGPRRSPTSSLRHEFSHDDPLRSVQTIDENEVENGFANDFASSVRHSQEWPQNGADVA